MTNQPRARSRSRRHRQEQIVEALEHCVASAAVTELIEALRTAGYDDPYTTAVLLAGAQSLIRGMPNKAPWAALLARMAVEVADDR